MIEYNLDEGEPVPGRHSFDPLSLTDKNVEFNFIIQ